MNRIARFADMWLAPSYVQPLGIRNDLNMLAHLAEQHGRDPGDIGKAHVSWIYILKPGENPENAIPAYSQFSDQNLEYWKEHCMLGERDELIDRLNEIIRAFDGLDWFILNPLEWDHEQLEHLATEIIPHLDQ